MKRIIPIVFVPVLAGCLTSTVPSVAEWIVQTEPQTQKEMLSKQPAQTEFGIARLSLLSVRAPYDSRSFQVLRADGTIASDSFNRFAAVPSQLLKGLVLDRLAKSTQFTTLVASSSSASVDSIVEVTITKLLLDCTNDDSRLAEAELTMMILDRERQIVRSSYGRGVADAKNGDYGKAFADALKSAIDRAIGD